MTKRSRVRIRPAAGERRKKFLLQCQLSVLTLISLSVPPRVTAVKDPGHSARSAGGRLQPLKHAYTLRMWLCMKLHGAWLYGVHRICAETAAVSCGSSHASAVSTPLWWIFKKQKQNKKRANMGVQ